ncbi:MAG TPA: phosphatase PAP2 family protein [Opitutaceae bacterium]|jgi:membrane-associated phospholipid phosphatase|nr:phosphatase PAP2 family protein [Opitutaceae bacterium]
MDTPTDLNLRRRFCWAALSAVMLIVLSVVFVDRPASTWSHATLHRAAVFDRLTWLVNPILPTAVIGLAAAGVAAALGWRQGSWGKTLIACCLAAVIAVVMKEALKFVFGRTWPESWIDQNPSWIGNGAYGFHFFHGGQGWASFPSGHMTMITAPAAVLWQRARCLRWLWAVPVLAVAIGLFGSDYHFIGDMIAGVYLGAACAAGAMALVG